MTKFLNYKVLSLVAGLAVFASCSKDNLDLAPTTAVNWDVALSSENDLKNALNGAYAGFRDVDLYGRTVPVIGDVMGDNAYQHTTNTNRYTLFNAYTFNVTDGNVLGLWTSSYNVILRANNIINSKVDTTGNATVKSLKGQAYAIRALSYFTLVRYFARPYTDNPNGLGVPIVTAFDPEAKPGRAKVSEVYSLILSDLTKAYNMTTNTAGSSTFGKYSARGLQAKVYLTMGDYENAKTAALDVINNSNFKVVDSAGYVKYWEDPAVRTDRLETLFEVSSDDVNNLAFDALSYLYSQRGNYGDFLVTTELNQKFAATDVRKGVFPVATRGGASVISINKYPAISGDRSDTKVLRMSEMYLIAAEAFFKLGDETNARTYLNYIRTRRGLAATTATGDALFEEIIDERRRELALEGDRYMDLQRLKRDVVRGTNYPAAARSIPYSNFRRILPIPQSEIDANPILKEQQNPGY